MNYTREPIIETVITPKEGCKIVLRNSKGTQQEDYLVDAVEVVSFGSAIFFRSLERPKPFLLPVADFEVVEVKETKMVLKAVSPDRQIKIAGGKSKKQNGSKKDSKQDDKPKDEDAPVKKSLKRRTRRKKVIAKPSENSSEQKEKGGDSNDETKVSSSPVRGLLPPPTTLIKEKLSRIKNEELPSKPAPEKKVDAPEPKVENKEETT